MADPFQTNMFNCQWKPSLTSRLLLVFILFISDSFGTKTRSVQDVLVSIEEKLRSLENLGHTMRFSDLHYGIDQMSRRIDAIEGRLSQMETQLNARLDKMNEAATTRDRIKLEHIVRKIEATSTRKAATLDAHSRVLTPEKAGCRLLERMEQMLDQASKRVDAYWKTDLESKSTYEEKNADYKDGTQNTAFEHTRVNGDGLPAQVSYDVGRRKNEDARSIKSGGNTERTTSPSIQRSDGTSESVNGEVEIFTRKVMNTYQELLKEAKTIDVSLKEVIHRNNRTRISIAEAFRKLHNHQTKTVAATEELLQRLLKKVVEMSATVDSSFASLLVAQNTFITSCHWVQQQQREPVADELRIENMLDRMAADLRNRTTSCDGNDVTSLKEAFESHERDVGRALRDLVWTVIEVGNQTVQDVTKQMCRPKRTNELPTPNSEAPGTPGES